MSCRAWPGLMAVFFMACAHSPAPAPDPVPAGPAASEVDPAMQALAVRCVGGDRDACRELSGKVLTKNENDEAERLVRAWQGMSASLPQVGAFVRPLPGLAGPKAAIREGVLLEVYEPRPMSSPDGGSPHFGTPYDARLGYIDGDGDFVSRSVDRRFFQVQAEGSPQLREVHRLFSTQHRFKVGDLVTWKAGLRNRKRPSYAELAIVMRVEERPLYDAKAGPGGDSFREPLTLWLGVLDEQGNLWTYYFDGQRMEPTTETSGRATALKDALKQYQAAQKFQPGQLVKWKTGLRNRAEPKSSKVGIVLRVFDTPIRSMTSSGGSTTFNEPLSVVVGVLDNEQDLLAYHVDGNRLEVVDGAGLTEAATLRDRLSSYHVEHDLRPGDLVTWKRGLRNKTLPAVSGVGIVVDLLPKPLRDEDEDADSSYFNENLDIRIGVFSPSGEFTVYHYDKRRFEPYRTTVAGRD